MFKGGDFSKSIVGKTVEDFNFFEFPRGTIRCSGKKGERFGEWAWLKKEFPQMINTLSKDIDVTLML